jgi:serine carboxypeptidase-like clade 2
VANVIFLESPAGVGFSYSNTSSDYHNSGDARTAVDAYKFLLRWLERFPEYKGRDFYIAGESYAGHYVPQLATVIVAVREFTGEDPTSLKGIFVSRDRVPLLIAMATLADFIQLQPVHAWFQVGNPFLDHYMNDKGALEFLWNHGVMSDEMWANINAHCSFGPSDGILCDVAKSPFRGNFFTTAGQIDPYNIYAPICIDTPNGTTYPSGYVSTMMCSSLSYLIISRIQAPTVDDFGPSRCHAGC